MGIKLDFNLTHTPEIPTFVLATRNGTKIGQITNITDVRLKPSMKNPECSFTVHKYDGDKITPYWDDIQDFKLVWCKEMDVWFEAIINCTEADDTTKQVTLQRLGEAELSQIKIYGMEVNTEDDILRDDYVQPTLFYNEDKPEASLMHRLLNKVPHYKIKYIDEHLKGIQKIFSFNDKTLKECFDEIEESMDILFVYDSNSKDNGRPDRTISVYDLKSYCKHCGARGSFVDKCLNCGSTDITEGYGVDTTIMVSRYDLGNEVNIKVNTEEIKNCYRLEGGDDLMTATIRNCNPNGTSYIWDFAEVAKRDMDDSLVQKIEQYKDDYSYYKNSYVSDLSSLPLSNYNALVNKYNPTSEDLNISQITSIVGYAPIMQHYYDTIDFVIYLQSGLLPNIVLQDTTAKKEAEKLTSTALSPVAVVSSKYITLANASTAVLNAAKIASDPRYKIKVNQASLVGNTWTGNFTITNYSDERDTYTSSIINVVVNEDYSLYINQKLKKTLYNGSKGKYGSISQMVDEDISTFQSELRKYNLTALSSFNTCFTECVKLLSEQGVDKEDSELYNSVYIPVYNKIGYIQAEISVRENEIAVIQSVQNKLIELKTFINNKLDLEIYLGENDWLDFSAYRREDTYSNGNYISDYLNNKELFERAEEFVDMAEYEISKSSNYKHEITSTLKNLLTIKEFEPLIQYFECGNWIRILDDDGEIYRLRLIDYEINFEDLNSITVTFSDVVRTIDGLEPVKEILIKSSDIINNYNAAMNKTNSNFESISDSMSDVAFDSEFNSDLIFDSSDDLKDDITETIVRIDKTNNSILMYVGEVESGLNSKITQTATEIKQEVNADFDDVYGEISLKVDRDKLASEINLIADNIILSGNTTFTNGDKIQDLISNAQSTANSASSSAHDAYSKANSASNALETYKTACVEGTTTINGGCIATGTLEATAISTNFFTTAASTGSGWTIQKHETYDGANYICGNNGVSNNVVLKTGGEVAFACGMDVGYNPGDNTGDCNAKVQIYHNGNIKGTDITCNYITVNYDLECSTINGYTPITVNNINNYIPTIPTNTNQLTGDFRTGSNGTYVALANSSGNKYLATTEWVINYVASKLSS